MPNFTQNRLFYIIGGFVVVMIIVVMFLFLSGGFGPKDQGGAKANLQFWGVFDEGKDFRSTITTFENNNPGIRITFRQFNFADYEQELVEALASGKGPDIFMMHNTWLPKHFERIQPLPQRPSGQKESLFTINNFREQFVDVAQQDLLMGDEIYALPLYVDSLALYYNKDIFNSLAISQPPATWEEFNELVAKITQLGGANEVIRAGAAIGTAKNVNRSTDILSLLMMQSGVPMADPATGQVNFSRSVNGKNAGEVALQYYTDFANPAKKVYTWNERSPYSIDAFQQGTAAMMFNYSHQIGVLRSKAPRLNFGVAPMPQLSTDKTINYANYWAAAVSKFSPHTLAAWQFLVYLTSPEGIVPYLNSTEHSTARRDLIDQQKEEFPVGVFAKQSLSARSWYQVDNVAIENIIADMIADVNSGRRLPREALEYAESQINLIVEKKTSSE